MDFIQEQITEQHSKLNTLRALLSKEFSQWTAEETGRYTNHRTASVEKDLVEVQIQLLTVQLYLKKSINDWTDEEKEEYGNKEQLRKEKEQVWKKKEQLREQLQKEKEKVWKKEEQLRNLDELALQLKVHEASSSIRIPLKRNRSTASQSSRTSRASTGDELGQHAFRTRIKERDINGCVFTGRTELELEACHIVPWAYFQNHDLVGKVAFDTAFPESCDEANHRIMDVRNGILMCRSFHQAFDRFEFTILRKENGENGTTIVRYVVETLPLHEFPASDSAAMKQLQERIHSFNGKEISFNSSKPNKWPGGQFLAFHNRCFYKKREVQKMKAQADPQELNEEGFGQTSAERSETTRKVKRWLATIDDTDLPSFIE
ncbi:hypothetical protein BC833DRAFT_564151 [Globomyces pollinis-pini]|nr:hypothetical protein BC833DRAFT_564151 [Globomyces pollinis-pini]